MTRIKDAATTATAPASDDYILLDGATNGSRKMLGTNMGALKLITETVTSGSATNVSFTSIPATYRDLRVVVRGRGTKAAANCSVQLRFNADTGANYDRQDHEYTSTGAVSGQVYAGNQITIGYLAAASATANVADVIEALVADYRGTTFQKAVRANSTLKTSTSGANVWVMSTSGWWRSTAAITQIDIFPDTSAFVDGTVVSLYGIY